MNRSAIPVSKAKTAYGLLSEIRKLILEEPLRYDQCSFTTKGSERKELPMCGTVCCIAGWVAVLKAGDRRFRGTTVIEEFATETLGLTGWQSMDLFDASAAGDNADPVEHSKAGARLISDFQKDNAAQLKAKRV